MDTKDRALNLLSVVQRLCDILQTENKALAAYRPASIRSSIDEKTRLSKAYELLSKSLAGAPEELDQMDDAIRERLKDSLRKLNELLDENAEKLKTAIEAGQRVMAAVANAAKETSQTVSSYGPSGAICQPHLRKSGEKIAISVNETF